jgi:hypothetical protein
LTFDIKRTRDLLQDLDFKALFNELGWTRPKNPKPVDIPVENTSFKRQEIAGLGGVAVFEIQVPDGKMPDAGMRRAIHKIISSQYHENLLIFLDKDRSQSIWYWVKREENDRPRESLYVKGQPGDLFISKLEAMVFDVTDFDESGNAPNVIDVVAKLKKALDVEQVTKRFYEDFKREHTRFLEYISGIDDDRDRRWYASVLLNRLMFIYFLQRKGFIDNGNYDYLQGKLAESRDRGTDLYYREFLNLLFFEGFAKPEEERTTEARKMLGKIKYLNGGLFLLHPIEERWPHIRIPDIAFEHLLDLFSHYTWNLDDTPGGDDNEISPHVLGYIFEKYINQKFFGTYYTRPEITEYLCERTIDKLILEKINATPIPGITRGRHFDEMNELLTSLDARLCRELLVILPTISVLDPACGSGAFLVSAMNTLTKVYGAITGRIEYVNDSYLTNWLKQARTEHDSLNYYVKKKIITDNLFGVDIMEEATEIAKLRLFLALVSSVQTVDQLEPLPNIDFNILPGNSLIGFLQVNEDMFNKHPSQLNLFQKRYQEVVEEKNRLISAYKNMSKYTEDLHALRDNIQAQREEAIANLNELLLDEFNQLGVKYEQATWDNAKKTDGRPTKRALRIGDIAELHPFHWGYEFDQVMNVRGGFDIIITNPPWEALKPQAKEFFAIHSDLVSKNTMRIEEFETERAKLLQGTEIRDAWLKYQSAFPFQSAYFRSAPQYENQVSTVNGKKQGTDINLYKLFTEQCYNLLHNGGQCGIVIPSGIYTDLGAKQLREMLFGETEVTGIFCFENSKAIFEGVHRSFKFVVLTYEKGGQTQQFPAAFMRHDVAELDRFPRDGALEMSVELVRHLSPDSLSVMEFKNEVDVEIAQKMLKYPLLGEKLEGTWNLVLGNEFHMTNDSHLFRTEPGPGRLPLYEGKMIHQFTHRFSEPRYWIDSAGRSELVRQEMRRVEMALDTFAISQGYVSSASTRQERVTAFLKTLGNSPLMQDDVCIAADAPRLAFRDIARNTDERTLISTILPPEIFAGNTLNCQVPWYFNARRMLLQLSSLKECYEPALSAYVLAYLCGVLNSFTLDYLVRFKVSAHVNMFYFYQLPVPRLTEQNIVFRMIAERAAKLICTTPEFQGLWQTVMSNSTWSPDVVAINQSDRAKLRAELDGIIAHLYDLTEEEFRHILRTFPLVDQPIKDAAMQAYHEFALEPDDLALKELIDKGETDRVEFKVAACWNAAQHRKDDSMRDNVIQEVDAFLNSREGGTLLIGVEDNGTVVGLEDDCKAANMQKQNRDGYYPFLLDILRNNLVSNCTPAYKISFGTIQGKDVYRIDVEPATEPVYTKGNDFYIREGNRKRKLPLQEAIAYARKRWG